MSGKIFLNYRRDDSRWPAGRLYDFLAQAFPREQLFMDVEGYIRPGDDFVEVLEEQVSACEVMIVVIGPQWLSLMDDGGSPRIFDARDFVHVEIATALAREIKIIPVLVDGASMPRTSQLPEPLQPLARRQTIQLSHERFSADGQGILKVLQEAIGGAPTAAKARLSGETSERSIYERRGLIVVEDHTTPKIYGYPLYARPGSGVSFQDVEAPWCPEMVVVPAGEFLMGTAQAEIDALCNDFSKDFSREGPQHKVTIAKPFAVGRFPVTRGEFIAFVEETGHILPDEAICFQGRVSEVRKGCSFRNPGFVQVDSHPVVCVSWYDAMAYAKWLSGKTGKDYRLPSEAEWEYACRSGRLTPFWWGSSISTEQANYDGNSTFGGRRKGEYRRRTVPVKSFEPNPWGLYQVHGNVSEWCEDRWNESYSCAPSDGLAWTAGDRELRPLRGGSWYDEPWEVRAAYRLQDSADERFDTVGFRIARTLTP